MVFALRPKSLVSLAEVEESLAQSPRHGQLSNWGQSLGTRQKFIQDKMDEFKQNSEKAAQDYDEACRAALGSLRVLMRVLMTFRRFINFISFHLGRPL